MKKEKEQNIPIKIGKWISNKTAKPFYARTDFFIKKGLLQATAKVTGLGQFIFHINGKKVEKHQLDPGWTNYDKKVQYLVFDILDYVKEGKNTFGIEVGNGWYIADNSEKDRYFFSMPPKGEGFSFMPPNPNPYEPFGKYITTCGLFIFTYEDGSVEEVETDADWKVYKHPVTYSNVHGSEIYDARNQIAHWNESSYDAKKWEFATVLEKEDCPKGQLVSQTQPPIHIKKTYAGVVIGTLEEGTLVVDLGQNMAGLFEITIRGKRGQQIHIYPAEKCGKDGDIDTFAHGWTMINTFSTYIIGEDDREETYCPLFSYGAGRYLRIEGVSTDQENKKFAYLKEVKGHFITSACKETGTFTCDDKRYEQIYNLVEKAVESNLQSVHTDCPSIEKIAWQEPNHLMAPSIMYMKNVKSLWEKIMDDLRLEQWTQEDYVKGANGEKLYLGEGLIPSQAPCYEKNVLPVPGIGNFYDIIPWGSSIILAVYWHYIFYGDLQIVRDHYDAGVKYLNYLKTKVNEDGFINHGLGDWGNPMKGANARENIETAFLYADAKTLALFARWLEKEKDQKSFESYAEEVKNNYNEKLLVKHPDEDFYCYSSFEHSDKIVLTQACEAIPLYWGLVPKEKEEDIVKALSYVLEQDQTFISGEVGLPYIIQTMKKYEMNDQISQFLLKEEHPSYYAFVLAGETTLPEYWEENARSHNHDMMGHIVEWYYNGIAGIEPLEPGFSKVQIKPYLPSSMKMFQCSFESVRGTIRVGVTECEEQIEVKLSIPNGVRYKFDERLLIKRNKKVEVFMV